MIELGLIGRCSYTAPMNAFILMILDDKKRERSSALGLCTMVRHVEIMLMEDAIFYLLKREKIYIWFDIKEGNGWVERVMH